MDFNKRAPMQTTAFTYTEYLNGETLEAYSYGHGHFIQGIPGMAANVSFGLTKYRKSLNITIYDHPLNQWLRAIPSLRKCLDSSEIPRELSNNGSFLTIEIDAILPLYAEISTEFEHYKSESLSFDTLELFVLHFLREGSVFLAFGLEYLHQCHGLTTVHLLEIQSQHRSMFEDLCHTENLIGEVYEEDRVDEPDDISILDCDESQKHIQTYFQQPIDRIFNMFGYDLRAAIARRDFKSVANMLPRGRWAFVSPYSLRLALRYYDSAIFSLLLETRIEADRMDMRVLNLKHRIETNRTDIRVFLLLDAAKAGNMDAVKQLVSYHVKMRPVRSQFYNYAILRNVVRGGHLGMVRYLVQGPCTNIDASGLISLLSDAFEHRHREIYDYVLRLVADLPQDDDQKSTSWLMSPLESAHSQDFRKSQQMLMAEISDRTWDILLSRAASQGYLEIVKFLVASKLDIGSVRNESPLYHATLKGQLNIVRFLLKRARHVPTADIVLLVWHAVENSHLDVAQFLLGYHPDIHSTFLATMLHLAAISRDHRAIVRLSKLGAKIDLLDDESPLWKSMECGNPATNVDPSAQHGVANHGQSSDANLSRPKYWSHWDSIGLLESHSAKAIDVESCPAVAALRDQERRATASRLFEKIKSSRSELLNLEFRVDASDTLKAFVHQIRQVRNRMFTWRIGSRAIRGIIEGYMPSGLLDVVSALQVADAMRVAVPASKVSCSGKEFVDDIPRWASLLSAQDQSIFSELVLYLWGIPATSVDQETGSTFDRDEALRSLQELVSGLVKTSELFEHGFDNACGGFHPLQNLRELTFSTVVGHLRGERHSLAEWDPFPTPEVHDSGRIHALDPPDPGEKQVMVLARITILVAGAIFGAVLLYLYLSRHGLSTVCLSHCSAGLEQAAASDRILSRNSVILAMYIGATVPLDLVQVNKTSNMMPLKTHSLSTQTKSPKCHQDDTAQEHVALCEGDHHKVASPEFDDISIEYEPPHYSPSLSSHPTMSTGAATSSSVATTTPSSTITAASEDGTIRCQHCTSEFRLGKNGRRGQSSNFGKHMRNHHPEAMPGHRRVLYKCRWDCGATDPNRSNIEVHMRRHCWKRKSKQPRKHGKWHGDADAMVTTDADGLIDTGVAAAT